MADDTLPGAEAGATEMHEMANSLHFQMDELHNVSALLLAIIDAEENHTTRLATMARNVVEKVRNEIDAVQLALQARAP